MQQEEFKKVVLPLRGRLVAVAGRMLSGAAEAEDAVQETLLKLWGMREELLQVRNIAGLAVRITKNNCLNRLKSNRRRRCHSVIDERPDGAESPLVQLETRDRLDRTMAIVGTLPEVQQAILRMRHIDGLEVAEIAELTASTPEAVRMNLSRARRRVKEIFMKDEK
jgi:RNA polymerase sigma-70 factor (ECF subfamily)